MSEVAMKHVVGGDKCATGAGEHDTKNGCAKHSNDYNDNGTNVYADGGDFSQTTMNRLPPCSLDGTGNPTPGLTDSSLAGVTTGIRF